MQRGVRTLVSFFESEPEAVVHATLALLVKPSAAVKDANEVIAGGFGAQKTLVNLSEPVFKPQSVVNEAAPWGMPLKISRSLKAGDGEVIAMADGLPGGGGGNGLGVGTEVVSLLAEEWLEAN